MWKKTKNKTKQGRAWKSVMKPWFHWKCVCEVSLLLLHSSATSYLKELANASSAILSLPDHSPESTHGLCTYKCLLHVLKLSWAENQLKKKSIFIPAWRGYTGLPSEHASVLPRCGKGTVQLKKSLCCLSTGNTSSRGGVHMETQARLVICVDLWKKLEEICLL